MRPVLLVVSAAVALGACGKSREDAVRDVELCGDTAVAGRIAACLRTQRGWDSLPSESAGAIRARELDSLYRRQEDSAWMVDQARHDAELRACRRAPGDVATCLRLAGWPPSRAGRVADSTWTADSLEHRRQIQACVRTARRSNIADCLMLYYKWDAARALAANDSVQRARMAS
jgi:hypothetical protein